ncbi:hypothetical protein [Pseudophaeobacter leonis]|uniref:hypothetical protein n=1 Tax=Pseudophaeobacter leonis TaxID=1144477 RepID=UPI0009F418BF|nr:hypothetical protein [Pseudophaeobacter leonis]
MVPKSKTPLKPNVLDLIWQKTGFGARISRRSRVTLQSEGEGEETLRLRDMATQSLCARQTAYGIALQ